MSPGKTKVKKGHNSDKFELGLYFTMLYHSLSYDVASESEITTCIKIDKQLVVYRLTGNFMK